MISRADFITELLRQWPGAAVTPVARDGISVTISANVADAIIAMAKREFLLAPSKFENPAITEQVTLTIYGFPREERTFYYPADEHDADLTTILTAIKDLAMDRPEIRRLADRGLALLAGKT